MATIEWKKSSGKLARSLVDPGNIIDVIPDIIYVLDRSGNVVKRNKIAEIITGRTWEEVQGMPALDFFPGEERARVGEALEEVYEKGYAQAEIHLTTKGGRSIPYLWTGAPLTDEPGKVIGMIVVGKDITKLKEVEKALRQSEEKLLQSQKIEELGRLTGGIAHDINNYLSAISGYCELVRMKCDGEDEIVQKMDSISDVVSRAANLIKQLVAFSRRQPVHPVVVNINEIVEETKFMMDSLIGEEITLSTKLSGNTWNVKVDPSQVEQIIANLIVNARDAMPEGGKIIIETRNVEFDSFYIKNHPVAKPGRYVLLAVSDTGVGMADHIKEKIFEPFFTTKELGIGSGLGLSTIYGIVKQNEGYIWVYSELGKGTTFKVYLPASPEEMTRPSMESPPEVKELEGQEKILLVEDNADVRESTEVLLASMGYDVISAANGEEAMEVFKGEKGLIDLLITDLVMPGMSGKELAKRIKEEREDIKVLVISGYTDDVVVRYGVQSKGMNFLEKPFSSRELGEKIRNLLE